VGKHIWLIAEPSKILGHTQHIVRQFLLGQLFYISCITLIKCSIVSCYLRVFPAVWFRRAVWTIATVAIAIWLISVLTAVFQCRPIQATWDLSITDRHCTSMQPFTYVQTGIGAATDILLCTLPLPLVWGLQIQKREKFLLSGLFGLGLL
jgi:hypothetical protein